MLWQCEVAGRIDGFQCVPSQAKRRYCFEQIFHLNTFANLAFSTSLTVFLDPSSPCTSILCLTLDPTRHHVLPPLLLSLPHPPNDPMPRLIHSVAFPMYWVHFPYPSSNIFLLTANSGSIYFTAHTVDSLLFQNPDVLHDLFVFKCVTTVAFNADTGGEARNDTRREELEYGLGRSYEIMSSASLRGGGGSGVDKLEGTPAGKSPQRLIS